MAKAIMVQGTQAACRLRRPRHPHDGVFEGLPAALYVVPQPGGAFLQTAANLNVAAASAVAFYQLGLMSQ